MILKYFSRSIHSIGLMAGCGVLLLVLLTTSHAAALKETVVFQQGQDGYHTFRIPALVKAVNGDLLAFSEGRVNSHIDSGDIDIVMKRSADGGLTWGALQVVRSDGQNTAGNPMPILDTLTGNLVLLSSHNLGGDTQSEIHNGTSVGTRSAYVQISTDNGATWSSNDITSSVKEAGWKWYATGPGHGIQLETGPHAGRLIGAAAFNSGSNSSVGGAQIIYSDDHGITWEMGAKMYNNNAHEYLPSESQAVELVNGDINVNSRNRHGNNPHYRGSAYITNGGETFVSGAPEPLLVDPVVQGAILRLTKSDGIHDKNRILFSNPADALERREMTVRFSNDETLTWDKGKMVNRGLSGYSDLVRISNAMTTNPYAGLLYENGTNKYYDKITFARFDTEWAESPVLMQIDFRDYVQGEGIASGGTVYDQEGNGIHGTMSGGGASIVAGSGQYRDTNSTALHFDGNDDFIRIEDAGDHLFDFEGEESFTIEAVFSTVHHENGGSIGSGPIVSKDVASRQPSYWMRVQDGNLRFLIDDGSGASAVSSNVSVSDGNWHHVAAVVDRELDELRLYIDYQLVDTDTGLPLGSLANNNDLIIGAFNNNSGTKFFEGDIELARISGGALSATSFVQMKIAGDYNGDGIVDAADYTIWRDTLNSTTLLAADGNGNGVVDTADYGVWAENFGNSSSTSTSSETSVPEPSALVLILAVAGTALCRRQCV